MDDVRAIISVVPFHNCISLIPRKSHSVVKQEQNDLLSPISESNP